MANSRYLGLEKFQIKHFSMYILQWRSQWVLYCIIPCLFTIIACQDQEAPSDSYPDESEIIEKMKEHPNERMHYKLVQSKLNNIQSQFKPFEKELNQFTEKKYIDLKPMILERNILEIQAAVKEGSLTYEQLVMFYLYRIRLYETNPETSLHTIIALNPNIIKQARAKDRALEKGEATAENLFGIPVLLKDNINTVDMPTTAGAAILRENTTSDAFLVEQLKSAGALILGKTNLSEWAYYFCAGCPLGYSAIGGQTLNPYGRMKFETGGSSSGSGVAIAANYASVAIGTETSGSILSPSSQNSVVGLKPTIGSVSRGGVVPISKTLDTAGPMTKSVIDNLIVYRALIGKDDQDPLSFDADFIALELHGGDLKGKKLGVPSSLMEDSLFVHMAERLKASGAEVITFEPLEIGLDGFLTLLNLEMKEGIPLYVSNYTSHPDSKGLTIQKIVTYNLEDTLVRAPYGQQLFDGILTDTTSQENLDRIRVRLQADGKRYFQTPMKEHNLDAILSINNYHASYAAVAHYPCLTIPMGYKDDGEPANLTIIAPSGREDILFDLGLSIERETKMRRVPENYN